MRRLVFALTIIMLSSSCENRSTKQEEAYPSQKNNTDELITVIERGKIVYFANCVSCHNNNPKKTGSIGPEVYGVSIDVLTKKIVSGKYPKKYIPKRESKIMPLMPHLDEEISNLHAFLNSS